MSVTSPNLTITLTASEECDDIVLVDATGTYPTAEEGYGLPDGPTKNSVTGVVITIESPDNTIIFTFVLSSSSITSATISVNGTITTISSYFVATVWPFTGLSLFGDYGVDIPTLTDAVWSVEYRITGRTDPVSADTAYDFSTSEDILISCSVCCCLSKKFQALDPECGCFEDAAWNAVMTDTYLSVAGFTTNVGNTTRAQLALDKATTLCNEDCGC